MTSCSVCKTPLNGKDEFIGHYVISHEWSLEQATQAWRIGRTSDSEHFSSKVRGVSVK
jgi:hypothetical protein